MENPTHLQPAYLRDQHNSKQAISSGDAWFMEGENNNRVINSTEAAQYGPPAYQHPQAPLPVHSPNTKGNPFVIKAPPMAMAPNTPQPELPQQYHCNHHDEPLTPLKLYKRTPTHGFGVPHGPWDDRAKAFSKRKECTGIKFCLAWALFFVSLITVLAVALGVVAVYRGRSMSVSQTEFESSTVRQTLVKRDDGNEDPDGDGLGYVRNRRRRQPTMAQEETPMATNIISIPAPQRPKPERAICATITVQAHNTDIVYSYALINRRHNMATETAIYPSDKKASVFTKMPPINKAPRLHPLSITAQLDTKCDGTAREGRHGSDVKRDKGHVRPKRSISEAASMSDCVMVWGLAVGIWMVRGML